MTKLSFSRQFLRRKDARRRLKYSAVVECRGVSRLATGDHVRILLTPHLSVEGTIAWSVWHKAGVKLSRPLAENDEIYMYLADQAAAIELARTRAVVALAQQHASRARQPDTD